MANVERLRKLRQRLLDHKEQFRYQEWCTVLTPAPTADDPFRMRHTFTTNSVRELKEFLESYSCNTCGCVAGHACMQAIEEKDPMLLEEFRSTYIGDVAQRYLSLDNDESEFLFMGKPSWRLPFHIDKPIPALLNLQLATVHDAIERLDVLIEYYSK
jgi:hypothetical protein